MAFLHYTVTRWVSGLLLLLCLVAAPVSLALSGSIGGGGGGGSAAAACELTGGTACAMTGAIRAPDSSTPFWTTDTGYPTGPYVAQSNIDWWTEGVFVFRMTNTCMIANVPISGADQDLRLRGQAIQLTTDYNASPCDVAGKFKLFTSGSRVSACFCEADAGGSLAWQPASASGVCS